MHTLKLGYGMATIHLNTAGLTEPPPVGDLVNWMFVLMGDPDVFMDLVGKVILVFVICAWQGRHVSLCHLNYTDKNRYSLSVCVRGARVDTFHAAPADTCICC